MDLFRKKHYHFPVLKPKTLNYLSSKMVHEYINDVDYMFKLSHQTQKDIPKPIWSFELLNEKLWEIYLPVITRSLVFEFVSFHSSLVKQFPYAICCIICFLISMTRSGFQPFDALIAFLTPLHKLLQQICKYLSFFKLMSTGF